MSISQNFNLNCTLTSCLVAGVAKLYKALDRMGLFHILLDQMGPFHILLDKMGLDKMGLDKVGIHQKKNRTRV